MKRPPSLYPCPESSCFRRYAKLAGYAGGARRGRQTKRCRGAVAPKYRNPENPAETWAGRGLRPWWLVAAIKGGKKLEDFTIGDATRRSGAKKKAKGLKTVNCVKMRRLPGASCFRRGSQARDRRRVKLGNLEISRDPCAPEALFVRTVTPI
jgi:H-NS histone family